MVWKHLKITASISKLWQKCCELKSQRYFGSMNKNVEYSNGKSMNPNEKIAQMARGCIILSYNITTTSKTKQKMPYNNQKQKPKISAHFCEH